MWRPRLTPIVQKCGTIQRSRGLACSPINTLDRCVICQPDRYRIGLNARTREVLGEQPNMRSFRLVYDEWLHRQPLLTKMVTSSVLFGLGDRLAQRVEKVGKTDEELEEMAQDTIVQEGHMISESAAKTVRMMVWGGMIMTPMMHTWYNLMEKVFVGTGKVVAAKKVVADMVFVAPQMPIWFYTSTGLMAGRTLQEAFTDSIEKQPMTLMANYMLWPAANSITYGVMPLEYRLLFANCVHLGWASFLSYMASHPLPMLSFLPSFKQTSEDPSHTHSS